MNKRKPLNCKRCGHYWLTSIDPKVCPKCHLDWREERKVVIQGTKKDILDYLDQLKKHYGRNATVEEVIDDIKRTKMEDLK